jgi:hypothetical protein
MPITREEARTLIFEALRTAGWNQFENLMIAVGDAKARRHGLAQNQGHYRAMDGRQFISEPGEKALISEVVWSLIIEGVLSPGLDDSNLNLPFLHLTEHGRECLQENRFIPHDPEGYLAEFRQACPTRDTVVEQYLTEALQCYLRSLHRAAAIMLGAASEQAVLLLMDAWLASIQDRSRGTTLTGQMAKAPSIFRKFDLFQRHLPNYRAALPHELSENIDSLLVSVFDLIRNSRNDAGHPARMTDVNRDTNYAHLRLFIPYLVRIDGLITWFGANQT